eukprot:jgi/Tetstr1/434023/TSEL_002457.t1
MLFAQATIRGVELYQDTKRRLSTASVALGANAVPTRPFRRRKVEAVLRYGNFPGQSSPSRGCWPSPRPLAVDPAVARQGTTRRPEALQKPKGCVAFWGAVGQHEGIERDKHLRKHMKPPFIAYDGVF